MAPEATEEVSVADISAALDNSSDSSGTQEPSNNDNSNTEQTQEPENDTSISDEGKQDGKAGANTTTAGNQDEAGDKPKFDNLDAALKGYANLEKKLGEQSNELGELRKQAELVKQLQDEQLAIAKSYGFESVEDFKNAQLQQEYDHKLASFEADQYAQFINECDYPEEMQKLLKSYRQNPTKETLELIEADFPVEIVKKVAGRMVLAEEQLQAQRQEIQKEQLKGTAKAYLDENVNKYAKEFENEAFVALYGEAFRAYGCDLDTDKFVELMRAYANSITKQANINNGINRENADATDEIAGLVNRVNAPQPPITDSDIDKMSDKELAANIRKYI